MADFDETYDWVVVGSGGGSMCSGLYMRSLGKSVLILEKTDLVGGTTARSGGVMWIPNNPFMKRDGIEDSFEKASTYLDGLIGGDNNAPGATKERRDTYLREGPKMVEFLVSKGIKLTRAPYWPDYYDEREGGSTQGRTVIAEIFNLNELGPWAKRMQPGFLDFPARLDEAMQLPTYKQSWAGKMMVLKVGLRGVLAKLTGKRWASAGQALQGRMLQAALREGVEIRLESPVSKLIEEEGVVRGVLTVKDGKPWRIGARIGVLVNAGGFALNQAMRDKYQPGTRAEWSSVPSGDTGEMIEEMIGHGAAIAQMDTFIGFQMTLPPGKEHARVKEGVQSLTAHPHAILVDQSGVRYMNEGGSYMAYCFNMLERNQTVGAVPSWAIVDSNYMEKYMFASTMPGSKKPQRWFDEGWLRKADTVEELARQIDIDPAALKGTVDRWNGFVAQGHDEDFHRGDRAYDRWLGDPYHKPNETLGAIDKPPFFAIPIYPGDVSTYGGVVTDTHARVLKQDGSVIPGLYATGVSTASVMGRIYPGAGGSVGPSFTWGWVAAHHAAGERV